MSKELKAFRKICKNLNSYEFTDEYKKNKKLIETALKKSEDMETWKEVAEHKEKEFNIIHEECVRLTRIKQKQDQVLKIIKECLVSEFKLFEKDGEYFILFYFDELHQLTFKLKSKEEYDLLREALL